MGQRRPTGTPFAALLQLAILNQENCLQLIDEKADMLTILEQLLAAVDEARLSDDTRALLPELRRQVPLALGDLPEVRRAMATQIRKLRAFTA